MTIGRGGPYILEDFTMAVGRRSPYFEGEGALELEHEETKHGCTIGFQVDHSGVTISSVEFRGENLAVAELQDLSLREAKNLILDYLQERYPIQEDEPQIIDYATLRKEWPNGNNMRGLLAVVSFIYNRAVQRELPATMQVAKAFGVSRATASRMIARAREDGFDLANPVPYPGRRKGNNGTKETTDR